jgi:hypothetical protein
MSKGNKTGAAAAAASPAIEKVHRFGGNTPALVQLAWIQQICGFQLSSQMGYQGSLVWCREDRLALVLGQGKHIFYAEDGKYLRVPGLDIEQILVSDRP